jgi:hypothetical protein
MVEEPTAPTTTVGFGSLFTAKPVFSSFAHGEEEATSMVPSSSSLASSSQLSGKRDCALPLLEPLKCTSLSWCLIAILQ